MDASLLRIVSAGGLFALIFLLGFQLRRIGKPYPGLLFNLHKLIGLGMLVYLILAIGQVNRLSPLAPPVVASAAVTVTLFVVAVITGGLVSLERPMPAAIRWVHKLFPYFIVLSTALTLISLSA